MRVLRALVATVCVVLAAGAPSRAHAAPLTTAAAGADRAPLPAVSVVPRPRYQRVEPRAYAWGSRVRVAVHGDGVRAVGDQLRAYLAENGVTASVPSRAVQADVLLDAAPGYDARLGAEGYVLHVGRKGITLRANTAHGLFYALQTLAQVSERSADRLRSREVTIVDWPAYRWRGIHLDAARHFFSVPVIERYIDVAARYKLNTFHWHLTDDQAWRLRSDRYPALTRGSAYSNAGVRTIVAYAAARHVTVVPELEMPGHADAALRAYPQLACARDTLCTSGAGLAFARDVLGEAMRAFPSPYLHAGGDEVLPPASAAQPRFTQELERYVHARGRRLVGWDEILTPRLSPRAVVMVWRGPARAAQAARHGNDVVVTSAPLYFDAAQGDAAQEPHASAHMSTLEQVYADRIMPAGLAPHEAAHVIGGQANVWTERIATPDHLFYMTLPRALALSEILWTPRERKSWNSFLARLPAQLGWLEAHGYPFRIPNASFAVSGGATAFTAVPGHVQSVNAWTDEPAVTIALSAPVAGAVIRYTTSGAAPTAASTAYRGPFTVRVGRVPVRVRAAAFLHGRAGAVTECAIAHSSRTAMRMLRNASKSWSSLVSP